MNWGLVVNVVPEGSRVSGCWIEVSMHDAGRIAVEVQTDSPEAAAHAIGQWWLENGAKRIREERDRHRGEG